MNISPFESYRKAYDAMNADQTVIQARIIEMEAERALQELRAQHEAEEQTLLNVLMDASAQVVHWEQEYRFQMDDAQALISQEVIAAGESKTMFNVEAKYSGGRKSTEWKSVALEMKAPAVLIEKYTKPGTPSVTVRAI